MPTRRWRSWRNWLKRDLTKTDCPDARIVTQLTPRRTFVSLTLALPLSKRMSDNPEIRFEGIGVSPGTSCGSVHVVREDMDEVMRYQIGHRGWRRNRPVRGWSHSNADADPRDAAADRRIDRRERRSDFRCAPAGGRGPHVDRRSSAQTQNRSLQRGVGVPGSRHALRRDVR